jgi:lipid A 3-O-deacylase
VTAPVVILGLWGVLMKFNVFVCVCAAVLAAVGPVDAQQPPPGHPATFHLFWENDGGPMMRVHPSDRHYTNGTALAVTWQPEWANDLAKWIPFNQYFGTPDRTGVGVTVGQWMFTPANIATSMFIPTDHPYAGYLYAGFFFQRVKNNTLDHFQFDFGVTGDSSLAQESQRTVHQIFSDQNPNGWEHQIKDEPTFEFTFRKKWKLNVFGQDEAGSFADSPLGLQAIPQIAVGLGTPQRYAYLGSVVRIGYHLPADFGPRRVNDPGDATVNPAPGLSLYGFGQAGVQFVQHDMFIQGNTWRDSPGLPIEHVFGEFRWGTTVQYQRGPIAMQLTYAQTFMTKQFKGQSQSDSYGGVYASVTWWF